MTGTRTALPPSDAGPTGHVTFPQADRGEALSDNEVLAAIAEGDRSAFAILMKRYLTHMVALAYRIIFDREQAREIAQEAFLRVWQNAHKWDPYGTASFLTWLRVIVVNLAISCRRKTRDHVTLDVIGDIPTGLQDGFDYVVSSDQKRIVQAALEKLPQRQRAAVALYYFDELPQIQAASIMQMTPKAFDSLIVRARTNLKKYLAEAGLRRQEYLQ